MFEKADQQYIGFFYFLNLQYGRFGCEAIRRIPGHCRRCICEKSYERNQIHYTVVKKNTSGLIVWSYMVNTVTLTEWRQGY